MTLPLSDPFPQRIVCLTEEPTEILYLLGESHRIVGISGFTRRPARARKEKPKVSAFLSAQIQDILDLKPDLVIGFSDIQADIARDLIRQGVTVWINNHRSVQEIYKMTIQLGSLVGKMDEAHSIVQKSMALIENRKVVIQPFQRKPLVYFEEWYDPLISGIRWVSELVEYAGGVDIFKVFQNTSLAKDRIIADPNEVLIRQPDIIIASWCGKKFKKDKLVGRPGWSSIPAVIHDHIYEIKSEVILQPGPASIIDGFVQLCHIIDGWHHSQKNL